MEHRIILILQFFVFQKNDQSVEKDLSIAHVESTRYILIAGS